MKSKSWPWMGALALVLALGAAMAMPHTRALAQPAPAPAPPPADQFGPGEPGDDDPGDLAWLDDDGPGGEPMEAPHDGPGGGWMGMGHGGMRGRGFGSGMGAGRMGMALGQLDLTDEQKKRMADIRDRQARTAIRAQADLRIAELDLRKLMRADTPDRRAIESQIEKMGSMRTSMQKSRVGMMFDMRSVLTQEQRDQLKQWRMNGGPRHDKRSRSESD